jgi:hypothetical protein
MLDQKALDQRRDQIRLLDMQHMSGTRDAR